MLAGAGHRFKSLVRSAGVTQISDVFNFRSTLRGSTDTAGATTLISEWDSGRLAATHRPATEQFAAGVLPFPAQCRRTVHLNGPART